MGVLKSKGKVVYEYSFDGNFCKFRKAKARRQLFGMENTGIHSHSKCGIKGAGEKKSGPREIFNYG